MGFPACPVCHFLDFSVDVTDTFSQRKAQIKTGGPLLLLRVQKSPTGLGVYVAVFRRKIGITLLRYFLLISLLVRIKIL